MARTQRELAVFLSKLAPFENPKRSKEQYPTDSNVAAKLLWRAHLDGTVQDRIVVDLGCGTGILSVGALILGAKQVIMVDSDPAVKRVIDHNMSLLESEYVIDTSDKYVFKERDARTVSPEDLSGSCTVIMNPPFGTSETHMDTEFLKTALHVASDIYSMHKTSTCDHIRKTVLEAGAVIKYQEDVSFMIKNTMKEHRKDVQRIAVSLFHFSS